MSSTLKQVLVALLDAVSKKESITTGDAGERWITTSNGKRVEIDSEGNVAKGLGGGQKGKNIKKAAASMSAASGTSGSNKSSSSNTTAQIKAKISRLEHQYDSLTRSASLKEKASLRDQIRKLEAAL